MSQTITLNLPDSIFQPLQRTAQATKQPIEAILLTALQAALPSPVAEMTDEAPVPAQRTIGTKLSRDEAQQRFEQEEAAYWRQRDELLKLYPGQWVAIVGGVVVAVGKQMNHVAAEASRKTGSGVMYVSLVGNEEIELRVRHIVAGHYDRSYVPAMPMLTAPVGDWRLNDQAEISFVIDTGADLTVLRHEVADRLDLWSDPAGWQKIGGIGGIARKRQLYNAAVVLAGQSIQFMADCRDDVDEDILGRDVINEFAFTCCAKREQVDFEWVEDART